MNTRIAFRQLHDSLQVDVMRELARLARQRPPTERTRLGDRK